MKFPVSIIFERKLNITLNDENIPEILEYIKTEIIKRKANNVLIEGDTISYEGSTSSARHALFEYIVGKFSICYHNSEWRLRYRINLSKLFKVGLILSMALTLFIIISDGWEFWWIGILVFIWPVGAGWVTENIRHGTLASDLAEGIDGLIGWKKPEPEEKDESLKSWF